MSAAFVGADEAQSSSSAKPPANRLARESSPYLLLHAHNPVDWYPWGPEAFEKARQENKPIFLSIGYSSCYWCHVMERLVFSNVEIARFMNEHFVNIKVDREERPDLDDIYMLSLQVYQQLAGSNQGGGWPLSMFLTPAGNPIAGGTYFPPEDMPGRPGFRKVMEQVRSIWSSRQADVERTSQIIATEVKRLSVPALSLEPPAPIDAALVQSAVDAIQSQYDPEYGGFDFNSAQPDGPKFPVPSRISLIQSRIPFDPTNELAKKVDLTLERMAAGGICDHVGGGFHRYSTDRQWLVPHFEKMLYDNAQLAEVYLDAYRRTNRLPYRRVAERALDFILRELTDPEGGFYSALDAETDGVEGKYYVWNRADVEQIVGPSDAPALLLTYGFNRPQPFEHGFVLHLPQPVEESARQLKMSNADLELRLSESLQKLLAARQKRPALLRDDKILTSWNGLAIRAFARAGRLLQRPDYMSAAERAAIFVLGHARSNDGRLQRTVRQGKGRLNAYLDDYAFLVSGLLELHQSTGEDKWLNAARRLTDDQIAHFWDRTGGGFFFTTHDHEQLIARTKNAYDSVIPAGNSVAAENLVKLAIVTRESRYQDLASRVFHVFAPYVRQSPAGLSYLSRALQQYLDVYTSVQPQSGAVDGLLAGTKPANSSPEPRAQAPASAPQNSSGGQPSAPAAKLVPVAVSDPVDAAKHDKLKATAYLSTTALSPGIPAKVCVVIDVVEGWHINANPAQPDFVIPTEVKGKFSFSTELKMGAYPPGHEFKIEGIDEPLSVYEGRIKLYGELKAPPASAGKVEEFSLTLRYQACDSKNCSRPMQLVLKGSVPILQGTTQGQATNQSLFEGSR